MGGETWVKLQREIVNNTIRIIMVVAHSSLMLTRRSWHKSMTTMVIKMNDDSC